MSAFCGADVCAARVQMFLAAGQDEGLREPCPQCVEALTEGLLAKQHAEEDRVRLLDSANAVIVGPW